MTKIVLMAVACLALASCCLSGFGIVRNGHKE